MALNKGSLRISFDNDMVQTPGFRLSENAIVVYILFHKSTPASKLILMEASDFLLL
jgi:hypothetical protein